MPKAIKAKGSVKTALYRLKIQLLQRGWDYALLAKAAGISSAKVRAVACGSEKSRFARRSIEAALDCAFWSTPQQHLRNQRLAALLGVDPVSAPLERFVTAAIKANLLSGTAHSLTRREVLAALSKVDLPEIADEPRRGGLLQK